MASNGFQALGLTPSIVTRCKELGFTTPTGVQAACIPAILKGDNVIANSPTGTGKTLTFALPIIQKCNVDPHPGMSLVITPSRELAIQIADQFRLAGNYGTDRVVCVIGGIDFQVQSKELEAKPLHIVATPGRLVDHFKNNEKEMRVLFRHLKYLVIDEADRVMAGNFDDVVHHILTFLVISKSKQNLFFSATMSDNLRILAKTISAAKELFVYEFFNDKPQEPIIDPALKQYYIFSPADYKDGYFMELMRMIRDNEYPGVRSMMVFAPTCKDCNILSSVLSNFCFPNVILHSHMKQSKRSENLTLFRSRNVSTLIATDVASRGLDIRSVDLVINYSVPFADDYIHRSGRAGRAGQRSSVITFVTTRDVKFLISIEKAIHHIIDPFTIEEEKVLLILSEVQQAKRQVLISLENDPYEERKKIYAKKRQISKTESGQNSSTDDESIEEFINARTNRSKKLRLRCPSGNNNNNTK